MVNAILMQLRDTAVIMGVIALVGLLLQKKSAVRRLLGYREDHHRLPHLQHRF